MTASELLNQLNEIKQENSAIFDHLVIAFSIEGEWQYVETIGVTIKKLVNALIINLN